MHVENLAVLDSIYDLETCRESLKSDNVLANNLSQIAAVGAICNSATFESDSSQDLQGHSSKKRIHGNATGKLAYSILVSSETFTCLRVDVAILRFSDSIAPAEKTRQRWTTVFRKNFNSKV